MSTTSGKNAFHGELTALVTRLDSTQSRFEKGIDAGLPRDLEGAIALVTAELFPGKCHYTTEFDHENPDDRYVVVNVEASGDPKEIVEQSARWHERVRQLSADLSGALRLSIVPR